MKSTKAELEVRLAELTMDNKTLTDMENASRKRIDGLEAAINGKLAEVDRLKELSEEQYARIVSLRAELSQIPLWVQRLFVR